MHRAIPAVVLLALFLAATGCSSSPIRAKRTMEMTVPHEAGQRLHVDSENGWIQIRVQPGRSDVRVEARLTCGGTTMAEAEQRVVQATVSAERSADGTLVVKPVMSGDRNGDGAKLLVELPDAHGLRLETSNGGVKITGATSGELWIGCGNGSITVAEHDGPARLSTSNGSISSASLSGHADLHTSNGSIAATMTPDSPGPVDLRTANGGIRLTVGSGFTGHMTMATSNGGVTIDDRAGITISSKTSRNRGRLLIDPDGPKSTLQTSNGRITVIIDDTRG